MKKLFTSFPLYSNRISGISYYALLTAISCLFLLLSATDVSAQAKETASVNLVDPSADNNSVQEPSAAYAATIATERANTALVLANPNLKVASRALYNGYDRMLAYIQVDLASGFPVPNIAGNNFKKVVKETPGDPSLKDMQVTEFTALYNGLVAKLAQH